MAPRDRAKKKPDKFTKLYKPRSKRFGIGQDYQPKRDLSHVMVWPKYIKLQRQKRILLKRLRVPPAINQFSHCLDKAAARQMISLLLKYAPETKQMKKERLRQVAEARVSGAETEQKRPFVVKFGINHIVSLVEQKKAKLVVIAHDVDPIEVVVYLPALCRKMGVPYCIVKSKSRLGSVVHQKTATALALTDVRNEDQRTLATITGICAQQFNENKEAWSKWGGGLVSDKSQVAMDRKNAAMLHED